MKLSLRDKRDFYHSLGRFLDSGASLSTAMKTLRNGPTRGQRHLAEILARGMETGQTLADSFAAAKTAASPLEISVLQAGERSGKMPVCCSYLSEYFGRLTKVRADLWKHSAYPLFIFHFAVLVGPVVKLVIGQEIWASLAHALASLAFAYGVAILCYLAGKWWLRRSAVSEAADRLLQALPLFGNTRRCLVGARFCITYEMQLQTGVNILDALRWAGQASQSALLIKAVERIQPELRQGKKAGDLLEGQPAFPRHLVQGIKVGEETGYLEQELARMAHDYEERGIRWMETIGEWMPRFMYLFVVLYSAWQVVSMFQGMTKSYQNLLNF
ncbi:MAG: type II secretion system F family protein [Chthoniobacteraceae bacterium]